MSDPRIPVFVGTYKVKDPEGSGATQYVEKNGIARVVKSVFDGLGLTAASAEQLEGVTVDGAANGEFKYTLAGSIGAKIMTLVSTEKNPPPPGAGAGVEGSNKTYRMSIPKAFPDHLFVKFVTDELGDKVLAVLSPRGRRYPIVDTTAP
jgi:hypothetical protein